MQMRAGPSVPANPEYLKRPFEFKDFTIHHDDWLVAMMWSLWHSRERSAKIRAIVESSVDPEEVEITRGLFNGIHPELGKKLQEDAMQRLDSLGEDNLESHIVWLARGTSRWTPADSENDLRGLPYLRLS